MVKTFFIILVFLSNNIYAIDKYNQNKDLSEKTSSSYKNIVDNTTLTNKKDSLFKGDSLISQLEIWQTNIPVGDDLGDVEVTISFFGTKFYQKDIDSKKYTRYEEIESIVSGFMTINTVGNKNFAPDCPFPDVNILPLQGIVKREKTIRLFSYSTAPIYSGSLNFFKGANAIEIYDIKENEGKILMSEMRFDPHTRPFSGKRDGPFKIKRIK